MGPLMVILVAFLIALIVNGYQLTERCHGLEEQLKAKGEQ